MEPLTPRLEAALGRLDRRIDWERRDRGAMRVDLAPMEDLCERLLHPERAFRAVHVGGTKGKGSVAALVAAALTRAGRRVGLYASPHVERVTERVRIDGRDAPDDLLAEGIEVALAARDAAEGAGSAGERATWFDLMTAAAFWAFRAGEVGWAVVEVGLGGRLDSTNVLSPALCVLTNVDLEHTALLGSTRAAIAAEKAGILKPGVPVVSGPEPAPGRGPADDPGSVIAARARALGAPLTHPAPAEGLSAQNLALARAALEALRTLGEAGVDGALLDEPAVQAAARLPGRLERARLGAVPVVLDGAHVPSSLAAVLAELAPDPALAGPCEAVVAFHREKDADGLLKALAGRVDRVHCTSVPSGLHRSSDELAARASALGLPAAAVAEPEAALQRAVASVGTGGWVLVAGSLYLVGAVRAAVELSSALETPRCSPSPRTSS